MYCCKARRAEVQDKKRKSLPVHTMSDARRACLAMLARREHSQQELQKKLTKKEFPADEIESVLQEFVEKRIQSDERFCEAYMRSRLRQGFGPQRIQMELQERGVASELIATYLENYAEEFQQSVREVFHKKFGEQPSSDFSSRAKQQRFLQYRGFSGDYIRSFFDS